ncbi:hypothetical protein GA0004736_3433 [Curtobacterium sp. 9128]|nr:hypothetical protein GA0004736_3433 [Curtobacterium sp. 9128]
MWHRARVGVLDNGTSRKYFLNDDEHGVELGHVTESDGRFLAYHRHAGYLSSWSSRDEAFEAIGDAE